MILPEVGAEAEIRFKNPITQETIVRNVTVYSKYLESTRIGGEERFLATVTGLLKQRPDKQVADTTDQITNPCIAERVIFNPPATIAIWKDGSKTVVKCDPKDIYDPIYGLALCYMKKAMGNTSRGLNDALRAGRAEMERTKDESVKKLEEEREKEEPDCVDLKRIRKFLKGKTIINYDCSAVLCPIKGPYYNTCNYCPYRAEPYMKCCKKLLADIQKIRKEDEEGKKE